jgi:hypothetical protein
MTGIVMKNVFSTKSLALAVLLAGILVSSYGISIIHDALKCKSWSSVKGKILHSSAAESNGLPEKKTRDVLKPYIVYEYSVDGRTYFSNNISLLGFGPFSNIGETYYSGSEDEMRELLNKYPVDSPVMVYYNPENIEESVIDAGLKAPVFLVFVLGLLLTYMSFHIYIYGAFVHLKDGK